MSSLPIQLDRLSILYAGRPAVEDVSLAVSPGTVYGLLGRNGAGKTSLVRCAIGLRRPDGGSARLFGDDAWTGRAQGMERVGVVPEDPDAPGHMTADSLSRFCAGVYGRWDSGAVAARLDRLGVPRRIPFARLSKGEKGAILFALALGHEPDLLVLDDPTLGLDAVARHDLYGELVGERADRGTTVFLTTHDLAGIEGIVDRVGILSGGRLVVDESVEDLRARFRRIAYTNEIAPSRAEYGRELDLFDAARVRVRGWGVDAVVTNFDEDRFDRFRGQEGVRVSSSEALSLEEIFLAVAGRGRGEERTTS